MWNKKVKQNNDADKGRTWDSDSVIGFISAAQEIRDIND